MKKMIKNNKLLILFLLLLVVLSVFCVKLVLAFTDNDTEALYGARLDGIEEVAFKDDDMTDTVNKKVAGQVESLHVRTQGRLVNIIMTVANDKDRDYAIGLGQQAVDAFTEEQKKYYDFQIFAIKNGEDAAFPVVGYKHHTRDNIAYTKAR